MLGAVTFWRKRSLGDTTSVYMARQSETDLPELGYRPSQAKMTVDVDPGTNLIRLVAAGDFTPGEVDQGFATLAQTLEAVRASHGRARVLVDMRGMSALAPESFGRADIGIRTTYMPEDRVAFLLPTSVIKARMRQIACTNNQQLFLSANAAEIWLSAWQ